MSHPVQPGKLSAAARLSLPVARVAPWNAPCGNLSSEPEFSYMRRKVARCSSLPSAILSRRQSRAFFGAARSRARNGVPVPAVSAGKCRKKGPGEAEAATPRRGRSGRECRAGWPARRRFAVSWHIDNGGEIGSESRLRQARSRLHWRKREGSGFPSLARRGRAFESDGAANGASFGSTLQSGATGCTRSPSFPCRMPCRWSRPPGCLRPV